METNDGELIFRFFNSTVLPGVLSFYNKMLPDWFDDDVRLLGNFSTGDTMVTKRGELLYIDHDTLESFHSTMSEEEFYVLLRSRDPRTQKLVESSVGW